MFSRACGGTIYKTAGNILYWPAAPYQQLEGQLPWPLYLAVAISQRPVVCPPSLLSSWYRDVPYHPCLIDCKSRSSHMQPGLSDARYALFQVVRLALVQPVLDQEELERTYSNCCTTDFIHASFHPSEGVSDCLEGRYCILSP